MLSEITKKSVQEFEEFSTQVFSGLYPLDIDQKRLYESILYSFQGGGKRFRPALTFAAANFLELPSQSLFPWALALEMIHTSSLIHDDLPCMDNDDYRRGKLTNHKVYGESLALLAGDALLTEAFGVLAKFGLFKGDQLSLLIQELSKIAGLRGMITGQYLDMEIKSYTVDSVLKMHHLKTGALISGCFSGPGILKQLDGEKLEKLRQMGVEFGFLFQIKDDILDFNEKNQDQKNIVPLLGGPDKANEFVHKKSLEIQRQLEQLSNVLSLKNNKLDMLTVFLDWNQKRHI